MRIVLSMLLFFCCSIGAFSKTNGSITNISIKQTSTGIEIAFTSDKEITRFQKPEVNGKSIIFRIKDVQHKIGKIPLQKKVPLLKESKVIIIENLIAYTFLTSKNILSTQISKKSDKVLVLTLTLSRPTKISSKSSKTLTKKNTSLNKNTLKKGTVEFDEDLLGVEIVTKKGSLLPVRFQDLNVIVIDPGHGGVDVGAISINGHYEKDITLAISLELQKLLKKNFPKLKVVMTRSTDEFVELGLRASIANKAKGDLFISIHCNATVEKPTDANGCETYILRSALSESATEKKENKSIELEIKGKTETKVTTNDGLRRASKEQSVYLRFSELFASLVQKQVPYETGLSSRGVQSAGFFVLAGAKMPNILFESGFLTNESDEKLLISAKYQKKIAKALFKAFLEYRKEFQSLL